MRGLLSVIVMAVMCVVILAESASARCGGGRIAARRAARMGGGCGPTGCGQSYHGMYYMQPSMSCGPQGCQVPAVNPTIPRPAQPAGK